MTNPRDVGTDATTTSFDGTKSIPKPKRKLYVASLAAAFVVTVGVSFYAKGVDEVFSRMGMKELPLPTELVLGVGRLLRNPLWLGLAAFAVIFVALLAIKGILDRLLRLLIGINVVWLLIFLVVSMTSWLALFKVAEKLKPGP